MQRSRAVRLPAGIGENSFTPTAGFSQTATTEGVRTTIKHREVIRSFDEQGTWSMRVNPGNGFFPWLEHLSPAFEFYNFRKFTAIWEPAAGTTQAGIVTLAYDYDVEDPESSAGRIIKNFAGAVSGPVWSPKVAVIDTRHNQLGRYYVRPHKQAVSGNPDYRLSDPGRLYVCVESETEGSVMLGQLVIEYTIDYFVPQLGDLADREIVKVNNPTGLSGYGVFNALAENVVREAMKGAPLLEYIGSGVSSGLYVREPGMYTIQIYGNNTTCGGFPLNYKLGTAPTGMATRNVTDTTEAAMIEEFYLAPKDIDGIHNVLDVYTQGGSWTGGFDLDFIISKVGSVRKYL